MGQVIVGQSAINDVLLNCWLTHLDRIRVPRRNEIDNKRDRIFEIIIIISERKMYMIADIIGDILVNISRTILWLDGELEFVSETVWFKIYDWTIRSKIVRIRAEHHLVSITLIRIEKERLNERQGDILACRKQQIVRVRSP
ncbi:hypothetical protein WI74_28580 [Burkholderia ubonensis]|nr:hypothetical protein WI74_28580 [Burkholderia ubonensis]